MAEVVEHLLSKHGALQSNSSTAKANEQKTKVGNM
jgi:hypothetical protein